MVTTSAWTDSTDIRLTGHGLTLEKQFQLTDSIKLIPSVDSLDRRSLNLIKTIKERASIETMRDIATFSIEVHDKRGGTHLANAGWASLWDFHLLSLAARRPCFILYSSARGNNGIAYSVANRNLILSPLSNVFQLGDDHLQWAAENRSSFRNLITDEQFLSAMKYFGNSHYLFDLEHRIMLLWAGIEGLLQVDAEHNRRIALYTAIMLNGTDDEKAARFELVKRSYSLRSRVVHGAKPTKEKLENGYAEATLLLADLLSRCVELKRVPSRQELDRTSFTGRIE